MGDMPEVISKGPILKKLEARYSDPATLKERFAALKDPKNNLLDFIGKLGQRGSKFLPEEVRHLREDWFNEKGTGWWQHTQPIEPIVRQGLIAAMEAAIYENPATEQEREKYLPIDIYWICHPGHSALSGGHSSTTPTHPAAPPHAEHPVEVSVSWNTQQVTLLLHTPDVPDTYQPAPASALTEDEHIVVIKRVKAAELGTNDTVKVHERDKSGEEKRIVARSLKNRPVR